MFPLISLVESAGTQLNTVSQHDRSLDETINTRLRVLKCFPHSDNAQTFPVKTCLRQVGLQLDETHQVSVKAVQHH